MLTESVLSVVPRISFCSTEGKNRDMKKNILHAIFFLIRKDHWDSLVKMYGKRIRPVALAEVEKFRYCGDIKKGFRLFVCEGCHDVKHVPIRCKEVLLNPCGWGESTLERDGFGRHVPHDPSAHRIHD